MKEGDARVTCESRGSSMLSYQLGKAAYIVLPSNERIIISIGTLTVKVLTKRSIIGWKFPKVIVSQSIASWEERFDKFDRLRRFGCGAMILDGLLCLVSSFKSIEELRLAWPVLRNHLEVWASEKLYNK